MVSLIIGHKGSGKTKLLVDKVNEAIERSDGHVICVEKETKLTYDVNYRARLVATDSYFVSDIFVDATFRIGGRDYEQLADFLKKVDDLSKMADTRFCFTISTDLENLPERMFAYCEKIN